MKHGIVLHDLMLFAHRPLLQMKADGLVVLMQKQEGQGVQLTSCTPEPSPGERVVYSIWYIVSFRGQILAMVVTLFTNRFYYIISESLLVENSFGYIT